MAGYIGTKAVALSTTAGNILGDMTVGGTTDVATLEFNSLSGTGAVTITDILDEDNLASNSATKLATQQSIKAYVDAQVDTVDTLAEILAVGNRTSGAGKIEFRDAAIYLNSSADGQLDIVADTEIQIAATTVDLNGNLDVSGTATATTLQTNAGGTVTTAAGNDLNIVYPDGRSLFFKEAGTTTLTLNNAQGATIANGLTLTDGNLTVANGHGIDFSATGDASGASAELFNDYEEGTFTPLLSGAKPGGGEVTYSSQIGHYTKIGNVVEFSLSVLANGSTIQSQSNEVLIAGLPFTVENISSQHFPPCSLFCDSGFNQSAATQGYIPVLQNGTTTIKIFGILSAAGSNQNAVLYNQLGTANSAASFAFRIAGTYRV